MLNNRNIDFVGKKKPVLIVTAAIIAVCLLFLIINGLSFDIKFTGGTILKYNYTVIENVSSADVTPTDASATDVTPTDEVLGARDTYIAVSGADVTASDAMSGSDVLSDGDAVEKTDIYAIPDPSELDIIPTEATELDKEEIRSIASQMLKGDVSVSFSSRIQTEGGTEKSVSIELADKRAVSKEAGGKLEEALEMKYTNIDFEVVSVSSVDPVMGKEFLGKCLVAMIIASVLMVLYVAFRFRKIGGFSAGLTAIVAVINDCFVAFTAFVVFDFPIDDNFFAVILTIIGYTLNSTIVIYDRVRENKKKLGKKIPVAQLVNRSINETLARTIYTNLTFLMSVLAVVIVALIFGISSILSFAVPMLFGIISGCYSSLFISNILWVMWQEKKAEKEKKKF